MRRSSSSSTATGASAVLAVTVKPVGGLGDGVEVAHPHVVDVGGVVGQQQRRTGAAQLGPAVLAPHAPADDAAELLGDELGAVADAEDRDAEVVDAPGRATGRRRRGRSSGRPTGSSAGRLALGDLGGRDAVRDDLGVDLQLAHPAGDQLGVLGAEVDDEHGVAVLGAGVGDRRCGRRTLRLIKEVES